ncbi:MAG: YlbL family protein [Actinomycetota bacterium]
MQSQTEIRDQPPEGPPPPQGARSRWRPLVSALVLALLVLASFRVPIPVFFAFEPGPARDVEDLVEVSGERTYSSDGSLFLTTVRVDTQVTVADWFRAAIDPAKRIVSREEVTGGQSYEEQEKLQREEMEISKQQARVVALGALGYPAPGGDGAEIVGVDQQAPAGGALKENDLIVEVNGEPVKTTCDASEKIGEVEPGDEVQLGVMRDGERETFTLNTARNPQNPGKAYVGVFMTNKGFDFDPGVDVSFDTDNIGGPSAGLMFTLALYDQLTPDDLTGGREIAGTGTIGCGGEVGAIGGIEQKVAGAEAEGAEVFLAPAGNYDAAVAAADHIRVVEVADFNDALHYLEGRE